jgi:uncharacterized membrane protein YoaK (UPF0700 family)
MSSRAIRKPAQTSETFRLSALLSLSGGLQDAYTYTLRGGVFANAQTGNIVLLSQSLLSRDWLRALHYLLPVLSFASGVLTAEQIRHRFQGERLHWRQIVLGVEIAVLFLVGFLPQSQNMAANMLVSFSCAMQVQSFRKVHGYGYASTMCIGNLRSGTESLSRYLRLRDKASLDKALHFFGIIFFFAVGAGIGGLLSVNIGIKTIWISSLLLIVVAAMMIRKHT